MRRFGVLLLMLLGCEVPCLGAQNTGPDWHGYIQTRFSADFDSTRDFMMRRAKLWVDGKAPGLDYISYKIQLVYRSNKDEGFMFQDAFADIHFTGWGFFRVGRFVPDFMLQRMQPDYVIPVLERAMVINGLIHGSQSMARQVGAQVTLQPEQGPVHVSLGCFNANLEPPGRNKDAHLLYTSHVQWTWLRRKDRMVQTGVSAAYRYAYAITMNNIFPSGQRITGNDYRWGAECQIQYKSFGFQAEYAQADIRNDRAWGYYGLATLYVLPKLQMTAFMDKYCDRNPLTMNAAWYGTGLNYYFTDKTKLMADGKTQSALKRHYLGEIQFQVMFN